VRYAHDAPHRSGDPIDISSFTNAYVSRPESSRTNPHGDSSPTEALEIIVAEGFKCLYVDRGTGAIMDGSFWRPVPPEGFYILGDCAKNDYKPPPSALCVRSRDPTLLVLPAGLREVWSNDGAWFRGSDEEDGVGGRIRLRVFEPIPPLGYAALGYVIVRGNAEPSAPSLRVVREDLVRSGRFDRHLWQAAGCRTRLDASFWSAAPMGGGVAATGAFCFAPDHEKTARLDGPFCIAMPQIAPRRAAQARHVREGAGGGEGRMPGRWLTVRLFLSSTFIDMHGERDAIIKTVVPELNFRARGLWVRAVPVDLRWGVLPTETLRIQQTCLNEIDNCRTSPHQLPWFIALRGERYGWIQDAYAAASEFRHPARLAWLERFRAADKKLSITSMEVHHAFLSAASTASDPTPHAFAYFRDGGFKSALPRDQRWVFDFDYIGPNDAVDPDVALQYTPLANAEEVRQDMADIDRAIRTSPLCLSRDYPCGAATVQITGSLPNGRKFGVGRVGDLRAFSAAVLEDLWGAIKKEYPPLSGDVDEVAIERVFHDTAVATFAGGVVGLDPALEAVVAALSQDSGGGGGRSRPLVLVGEGGVGKSALAALLVTRLRGGAVSGGWGGAVVLAHMVAASPSSMTLKGTLHRLCAEMNSSFKLFKSLAQETGLLRTQFGAMIEEAAERAGRILILIDGLQQLSAEDGAHLMNWLPLSLPANIRIVVTAAPHPTLSNMRRLKGTPYQPPPLLLMTPPSLLSKLNSDPNPPPSQLNHTTSSNPPNPPPRSELPEVEVQPLTGESRRARVRRYLSSFNKRLSEDPSDRLLGDQMAALVDKADARLPLYLTAACAMLVSFGVYEKLTPFISALEPTLDAIFSQLLAGAEADHGRDLIASSLGLIAVARSGLLATEVIAALDKFKFETESSFSRALGSALKTFISGGDASGMLQFASENLRQSVARRYGLDAPAGATRFHAALADLFLEFVRAEKAELERGVSEVVFHLVHAGRTVEGVGVACSLRFARQKASFGFSVDLVEDYQLLVAETPPSHTLAPIAASFLSFSRQNLYPLSSYPPLALQLALNSSVPHIRALADAAVANTPPSALAFEISQKYIFAPFPPAGEQEGGGGEICIATLVGHSHNVVDVDFSPDGVRVATASGDGSVRVWDAVTGAEAIFIRAHVGGVRCVRFVPVPEGGVDERLISCGDDGGVFLWSATSGFCVGELKGHTESVNSVRVSADGAVGVSASADGTCRVWDVAALVEARVFGGHEDGVLCVDLTKDGTKAVSVSSNKRAYVWAVETCDILADVNFSVGPPPSIIHVVPFISSHPPPSPAPSRGMCVQPRWPSRCRRDVREGSSGRGRRGPFV
jgi:telomerase protein component 1